MRHWQVGDGWRIGWHPEIDRGLIGADDWAVELSKAELWDCCRLALELARTMEAMAEELAEQETIGCSAITELVCVQADGFSHQFSLSLQLLTDRPVEGRWTVAAVPELLSAIDKIHKILVQSGLTVV